MIMMPQFAVELITMSKEDLRKYLKPVETEVAGKSYKQIRKRVEYYEDTRWNIYNKIRKHETFTLTEFEQMFAARIHRLRYEANKLWAEKILQDPHASKPDIKKAKGIAWVVGVNRLVGGALPPRGSESDEQYNALYEDIVTDILKANPQPDGTIATLDSFVYMESGDT